ncbi:flagella cluster protein (plasmid) [Natrialbaceae archaeon A-arb3/5]
MTDNNKGDPKESADVPPVLPGEQPSGSDGSGVLSPDELDISDSPYVAEVADGRYVVSADHSPPNVPQRRESTQPERNQEQRHTSPPDNESEPTQSNATGGQSPIRSPERARSILADELERTDSRYAIDIVSSFDTRAVRHRTTSDDVVSTFDNLVLWYSQHVATDTPTQRTAELLLAKSEFTPPLSSEQIRRTANEHGLTRSSTLEDLLNAIE